MQYNDEGPKRSSGAGLFGSCDGDVAMALCLVVLKWRILMQCQQRSTALGISPTNSLQSGCMKLMMVHRLRQARGVVVGSYVSPLVIHNGSALGTEIVMKTPKDPQALLNMNLGKHIH